MPFGYERGKADDINQAEGTTHIADLSAPRRGRSPGSAPPKAKPASGRKRSSSGSRRPAALPTPAPSLPPLRRRSFKPKEEDEKQGGSRRRSQSRSKSRSSSRSSHGGQPSWSKVVARPKDDVDDAPPDPKRQVRCYQVWVRLEMHPPSGDPKDGYFCYAGTTMNGGEPVVKVEIPRIAYARKRIRDLYSTPPWETSRNDYVLI